MPPYRDELKEKPPYDDWLPSALGQIASDLVSAWEDKPTAAKHRRLALLLDELLSLIEGDADMQQIFTRLPSALDMGLILPSFFTRVSRPHPPVPSRPAQSPVHLTHRERQVLQLMADGILSEEMIAQSLGVKPSTVHAHRTHIREKLELGVGERLSMVTEGVRRGLVRFDVIAFVTNILRSKDNSDRLITYGETSPLFDGFMLGRYMKPDTERAIDRRMRQLHLFSVVLFIASYLALSVSGDPSFAEFAGAVCEVNAAGEVMRHFDGEGVLRYPSAITIAPPQATRQGFAAGNLFVSDRNTNPDLFSADSIVELTPDGKFVRILSGGDTVGTRLVGCNCLTFAADGALLASSGAGTDSILRITRGGTRMERFGVSISPPGIAAAPEPQGYVYATSFSSAYCMEVYVFHRSGQNVQRWPLEPGVDPRSCILDADGNLLICDVGNAQILRYSPSGKRLQSFTHKNLKSPCYLAVSPDKTIYVSDAGAKDIKVFNHAGKLLATLKVEPLQEPRGVAVGKEGRVWVCGIATR